MNKKDHSPKQAVPHTKKVYTIKIKKSSVNLLKDILETAASFIIIVLLFFIASFSGLL